MASQPVAPAAGGGWRDTLRTLKKGVNEFRQELVVETSVLATDARSLAKAVKVTTHRRAGAADADADTAGEEASTPNASPLDTTPRPASPGAELRRRILVLEEALSQAKRDAVERVAAEAQRRETLLAAAGGGGDGDGEGDAAAAAAAAIGARLAAAAAAVETAEKRAARADALEKRLARAEEALLAAQSVAEQAAEEAERSDARAAAAEGALRGGAAAAEARAKRSADLEVALAQAEEEAAAAQAALAARADAAEAEAGECRAAAAAAVAQRDALLSEARIVRPSLQSNVGRSLFVPSLQVHRHAARAEAAEARARDAARDVPRRAAALAAATAATAITVAPEEPMRSVRPPAFAPAKQPQKDALSKGMLSTRSIVLIVYVILLHVMLLRRAGGEAHAHVDAHAEKEGRLPGLRLL